MFLFVPSKIICYEFKLFLPQRLSEHLSGHEAHGSPGTNGFFGSTCPVT